VLHSLLSRCSKTASARKVRDNKLLLTRSPLTTKLGKPVSHQFAKELLVGLAGAEVDRLAETKGADYIDRERAKHEAKKNAEHMYDQHYGNEDNYDPNRQRPNERLQREFGDNY
jgi:cysteine synthase